MKKRHIIGIVVVALILIVISSFAIYKFVSENGRKYEILEVKQYNYFILKQNNLRRSN